MSAMAAMVTAMIAPVLDGSALPTLGSADDDIDVPAAHREQIRRSQQSRTWVSAP